MYQGEMLNIIIISILLIMSAIATFSGSWTCAVQNIADPSNGMVEGDIGLWRGCTELPNATDDQLKEIRKNVPKINLLNALNPFSNKLVCSDIGEHPTSLTVIRIFSILGLLLLLISVILIVSHSSSDKYLMMTLVLGSLLSIAAAIIWATDKKLGNSDPDPKGTKHLGYSWYLELLSGVGALIMALLLHFKVIA
jgi:hypothetical protein